MDLTNQRSVYASLTEAPKPLSYVPMRQSSAEGALLIRTSRGAEAMTKAPIGEIHALDANLAPGEVITMQETVDRKTAMQRAAGSAAVDSNGSSGPATLRPMVGAGEMGHHAGDALKA